MVILRGSISEGVTDEQQELIDLFMEGPCAFIATAEGGKNG
jgi:hypothetical protein